MLQHFESQSHVRSQDDCEVTHTHPVPQEQQPQVEQKQEPTDEEPVNEEPTDEEPVNDPASSGLERSSDKHLPASDELLELSKEQQEAILRGSGDLSFNMSPWIRALVSIVYDFNEGLPEYCAEQVLVLSNCVPAEFQQTLQHQTTKQGTSWREFICSLQKTTPVTSKPVLLKFRGNRVEEEVLSSQSKLLGIGYSLLQSALDAWAVAAGHDSKFWDASDVFLMIANCQAIQREQSLRKDARHPESKFRILRKLADGKEVLAFRVIPTAARQFTNPTINQYYNGNSIKLHRAAVQSQSAAAASQETKTRCSQGAMVLAACLALRLALWLAQRVGNRVATDSTPGGRAGGKALRARRQVQGQRRVTSRPDACLGCLAGFRVVDASMAENWLCP